MMDASALENSAKLQPPRKSIELEDSGAHDLGVYYKAFLCDSYGKVLINAQESSENEEDVFSDAQEGHRFSSEANSPIPKTPVEKVLFTTFKIKLQID